MTSTASMRTFTPRGGRHTFGVSTGKSSSNPGHEPSHEAVPRKTRPHQEFVCQYGPEASCVAHSTHLCQPFGQDEEDYESSRPVLERD